MNSTVVSYAQEMLGFEASNAVVFLLFFMACAVVVGVMSLVGGLGTYAERKISADIQMRQGPNRVGPYGILQFVADGIKMMTKEDILPSEADKFLFALAPVLALLGVFASLAVLPFSEGLTLTHLNVGVFYLIGVSSLVGVAVFLAGHASNSKWSMLGGMRGASQIISYEVPVTLSILAIILLSGSLSFGPVVEAQGALPTHWFLFHNPFTFVAFFVLFIGILAEANRAPFDLPEAESELVSGYHTEYTGMRFAFFALAEYIEVFVVCAVAVSLFLGGYKIPFDLGEDSFFVQTLGFSVPWALGVEQLLQLITFFVKTLLLYYVVIWVRWTLPRLRVDQLMTVCWKYLTPMALINLVGVAVWAVVFDGQFLWDIIFSPDSAGGGH